MDSWTRNALHPWTRLGFVYEAGIHCESCAVARFGPAILDDDSGVIEDSEHNPVTPYTAGHASESSFIQRELGEYPHVHCDDCRALLYESDFGPEATAEEEDD